MTDPRMISQDARTLAMSLGIGELQASMVIPYMFMTPATTDPDMPPIHLLVRGLQRGLRDIGGTMEITGMMDVPTATALRTFTGPNWPGMSWYLLYQTVTRARATGQRIDDADPVAMQGMGFLDLPDPPGGNTTLILGFAAFWYFFLRGRKARR